MSNYYQVARGILALRRDNNAPIDTYAVPAEEVGEAETIIGKPFPDVLKVVWSTIGSGFFHASMQGGDRLEAVSCLMGPLDVADVMQNRGWVGPKATVFPFFNEDDEDFILLVETASGWAVEHEHARGHALAKDPKDFVVKLAENPSYWVDLLPSPQCESHGQMVLDSNEALVIATELLKDYLKDCPDVVMIADATEEFDDCFLVHYNTKEWLADRISINGLAGNWPVRVDKATGLARHTDMVEYNLYCKGIAHSRVVG